MKTGARLLDLSCYRKQWDPATIPTLGFVQLEIVQSYYDRFFPVLGDSFCCPNCIYECVKALQYICTSIFVDFGGKSISALWLAVLQDAHIAFNLFRCASRVKVLFYICLGMSLRTVLSGSLPLLRNFENYSAHRSDIPWASLIRAVSSADLTGTVERGGGSYLFSMVSLNLWVSFSLA